MDATPQSALAPGIAAPDFSLPATLEGALSLSELRGRPVVLAFYPADFTPVCSSQLALYNEILDMFADFDAALLGISTDDINTHQDFATAQDLRFPLLADSDPQGQTARAYGAYDEANQACERALFVIDKDGFIQWSYVSPKGVNPGADGILKALEGLA